MILTGPEIRRQVAIGQNKEKFGLSICKPEDWIDIQPYDESLVGPNSVDLRLHSDLKVYPEGARRQAALEELEGDRVCMSIPDLDEHTEIIDMKAKDHGCYDLYIPKEGRVLWPGILYLGRTIETIGSNSYVPIVEGRSVLAGLYPRTCDGRVLRHRISWDDYARDSRRPSDSNLPQHPHMPGLFP